MPFVDPEQGSAALAEAAATYAAAAMEPGSTGATGRAFPIMQAYYAWFSAELERGTSPKDVVDAMARVLGSLSAAVTTTCVVPEQATPALQMMLLDMAQWAFAHMRPEAQSQAEIHMGSRQ